MKPNHYSDYSSEDTELSERGLLTIWGILREFRDELVLVGGLVPKYLCFQIPEELHAVTMDVDLGISLALDTGKYDTISTRLVKEDFEWKEVSEWRDGVEYKTKRFVKQIGKSNLFIDFLTDKPRPGDCDSVMISDIPVSALPGVERALKVCREVPVCGHDLYGAKVEEMIRVCEVGPYVCLKLQAYHNRASSKDVFDMVRCVRDYKEGSEKAVKLFHEEKDVNPAYQTAICILNERFVTYEHKGPTQYADFCLGKSSAGSTLMTGLSGTMGTSGSGQMYDEVFLRRQRANEAFAVANLLLGRR